MKILVPTDFSASAESALGWGVELAKRFAAELVLLHVYPIQAFALIDGLMPPMPVEEGHLAQEAVQQIDELAARCKTPGLNVCGRVATGDAVHGILDAARSEGADLVVMGTHGRTGLAHLLLGSVAERVVRECHCPVLTVRQSATLPATTLGPSPSGSSRAQSA